MTIWIWNQTSCLKCVNSKSHQFYLISSFDFSHFGFRDTALNLYSKNFSGSKLHRSRSLQTRQWAAVDPLQSFLVLQLRKDRSVVGTKITYVKSLNDSEHVSISVKQQKIKFTFVDFNKTAGAGRTSLRSTIIPQQKRKLIRWPVAEPTL